MFFSPTSQADFTGSYDLALWNIVIDGGRASFAADGSSVTLISNNVSTSDANRDATFVAFEDMTISFDWSYSTVDTATTTTQDAQWDPFGYLLIGVGDTEPSDDFVQLSDNTGADNQSGTVSFTILPGETFGFRANTVDVIFGAATTNISGFSASPA